MSKPYTLASERADAPNGCAYVAPLLTCAWFRWEFNRRKDTSSSIARSPNPCVKCSTFKILIHHLYFSRKKYKSTTTPSPMRYQPNTLKSCFLIYPSRNLMTTTDTRNALTIPESRTAHSVPVR